MRLRAIGRRARRLPWGLLGMLALVSLVERSVVRDAVETKSSLALDWATAGRSARREAVGADVLCLGDSLVKFSIAPPVLARRHGVRAHNLAVRAGSPESSYILLRRAIEAGARPTDVVVDFSPLLLAERVTPQPFWAELLDLRDLAELSWWLRDPQFFGAMLTSKALPSLRGRIEIRAIVRKMLRGEYAAPGAGAVGYLRNWIVNRGAQIMPTGARPPAAVLEGSVRLIGHDTRPFDPVHVATIDRFLRLTERHRIRVHWLLTPVDPELQRTRDETGAERNYERLVRGALARFPTLTVLDARRRGYGPEVYIDVTHMHRLGAATLSSDVADALAAPADGGERWVALPAFRPSAEPIEDVEQSSIALSHRTAEERRR